MMLSLRKTSLLAVWVLQGGCTSDPLFCDENTRCSDPERPFCDLYGDYPASDGVARTCIPDPNADPGSNADGGGGGDAGGETGDAGVTADAGLACDARVALVSRRDGDSEVYLSDADGSNQTNLTQSPATDVEPRWSADGRRIAFVRDTRIWTMNADGSDPVQMTFGPNDVDPQWAPSGTQIAFTRIESGTPNLWVVGASGGKPTQLTTAGISRFSWSPDGTKLAFSTSRDGNLEIYSMNTDGSSQTNLTLDPASDDVPLWSRDGTQILFRSVRTGNEELWIMGSGGTNPRNLTKTPQPERDAVFTPDGSKIVYQRGATPPLQGLLGSFESDLYSMNSDGSGQRQLTFEKGEDSRPSVSSDGAQIAWTQNTGAVTDVYVAKADGTAIVRLTTKGADTVGVWQPCPEDQ